MSAPFDAKPLSEDLPIGWTVQSPVNLEALTANNPKGKGRWMAMDGRDVNRSDVDADFAAQFASGVFTSTARTLNATPHLSTIATDATNFLCPGAAGTSALQASPDGITWSTSATWGASTNAKSIIKAGTRFVMAGSAGDLSAPYVSAIDQTAADQVAKANWTATTNGVTTAIQRGLAYSPQLAMTLLVTGASGTGARTLADAATAWTSITMTTMTPIGCCWTGAKFMVVNAANSNLINTSTDGVTWTAQYLPIYWSTGTSSVYSVASDGAGTVVLLMGSNIHYVIVSKNHGATWRVVTLPIGVDSSGTAEAQVNWVNGRFVLSRMNSIISSSFATLHSSTGLSWSEEPPRLRGLGLTQFSSTFGFKSGVWISIHTSTAALTATEDMSRFKLPTSVRRVSTNVAVGDQYQAYVKVAI